MDRRFVFAAVILTIFSEASYADKLTLKDRGEGNEVKVIEEKPDAFIIKVPKEEIEEITRETPTEIELWREKKILWEDKGDYIAIHLPKERIFQKGEKESEFGYEKTGSLREGLDIAGADKISSSLLVKGGVKGRILRRGKPLAGCSVKIRYVRQYTSLLPFADAGGSGEADIIFETTTDTDGRYEFAGLTPGACDIFWRLPGETTWSRRLSEKPDVTVMPGEITVYRDIEIK